jgi:hypothetical protein
MKYEMLSVVVALALTFVLPGCERKPVDEQAGQLPAGLPAEAYQTYRNYLQSVRAGTEKASDLIPSQYWAEGIRAFNPLRVYIHRFNIVTYLYHHICPWMEMMVSALLRSKQMSTISQESEEISKPLIVVCCRISRQKVICAD